MPWSWKPVRYDDRCKQRKAQLTADLAEFVAYCSTQPNVVRIVAFGSFARNRVTPWSDLDLLIVSDGDTHPPLLVDDLHVRGPAVAADLIGIRLEDFPGALERSPFGTEILRDGFEVYARSAA